MVGVQTVSLGWQHAAELSGVLALGSVALRAAPQRHVRALAPFAFEAAIIGLLYAMWQRAGELSVLGTSGALSRSHWIIRFQHDIGLPSERSVQNVILGHPLLVQAANLYYDTMHFTMMFVFLIWLFVRHRDKYRPVRATMAWTTLACLLVQLIPVAPPRMIPGYIDTAMQYGQSVYSNGLAVDQLSAMPSVHVAWALIVGFYTVRISTSRWRWIAAAHSVITVFVVLATGNHWWLDGIVAGLLAVICAWGRYGASVGVRAALARIRPTGDVAPVPVTATGPAA